MMISNPLPLHPGKVLYDVYMAEMGLSQVSLAEALWVFTCKNQ